MLRATGPTSSWTRSRISVAALLVKVIARISPGMASPARSRCAIRRVSTRVLPEPAPATISSGLPRRSEEHTSELQSRGHLVCRLLLEKKKKRGQWVAAKSYEGWLLRVALYE